MANISNQINQNPDLSILKSALETHNLLDILHDLEEVTFFAPSNKAFEKLKTSELFSLISDPRKLLQIISSHIISRKYNQSSLHNLPHDSEIESHTGSKIVVRHDNQGTTLSNASISQADIEVDNGFIHVVDSVFA